MAGEPDYAAKRGKGLPLPSPVAGAAGGPGAEEPKAPAPESPRLGPLTTRLAYRLITPRRRWWAWGLAFLAGWLVVVGLHLHLAFLEDWSFVFYIWPMLFSSLLLLVSPVVLSVVLAVLSLKTDRDSRRLEPLALTKADYLPLLRAYHWRACMSGALLLAVLVPCWIAACDPGRGKQLFSWFGATVLPALSALYLGAALGLAVLVWMRSRAVAIVFALVAGCQVQVVGALYGMLAAWKICEWLGPSAQSFRVWSYFPITGPILLSVFLTEVALRLAARRLDRLITD